MTPSTPKARKPKKCKCCGQSFVPYNSLQRACTIACGIGLARKQTAKKARKEKLDWRKANLTRRDWIKRAQVATNRYVRARDAGKPCISCGSMPEQKFGGTMDCGHYRSTGSAPHIRFYTIHLAAQCVRCNRHLGGNAVEFRSGLIARIGVEKVEAIERMQGESRYTIPYLERLTGIMRRRAMRLEKRHEHCA